MRKILLFLCMAVLMFSSTAFAAEQTASIDFTSVYSSVSSNVTITSEKVNDDITLTFTGSPKYYKSGSAVRFYANNKITIQAAEGITITKVVFTCTTAFSSVKVSEGTFTTTNGTWVGEANSFDLTNTGTSQARFSKIDFEYETAGANLEPSGLAFTAESASINLGEETASLPALTNPNGLAVSYESSVPEVASIDAATGAITLVAAGTTVISASSVATDVYKAGYAEYTLTVIDPNFKGYVMATGIEDIYDGALALIGSSAKSDVMSTTQNTNNRGQVAVTITEGVITSVPENAAIVRINKVGTGYTFYVTNGGTTSEGYLYSVSGSNTLRVKSDPTTADLTIDDNGNATIKYDTGYSIKHNQSSNLYSCYTSAQTAIQLYVLPVNDDKQPAGIEYAETSYTVDFGAEFTAPELTNPNGLTVAYSSSNEEVATVDAATGAVTILKYGETTITAAFEGNDEFRAGKATYTLNVAPVATTLAQFVEFGKTDSNLEIKMNAALTVTYANGSNIYVTDGTTSCLIYQALGYETLDIIPAGWTGTLTMYSNGVLPEIQNVKGNADATEKGEFTPAEMKIADITEDNVNEIVVLNNVTFASATPSAKTNFTGTQDGAEGTFRNNFTLAAEEAGEYNVVVAVNLYKQSASAATVIQLYPISFIASNPTALANASVKVNGVAVEGTDIALELGQEVTLEFTPAEGYSVWYLVDEWATSPHFVKALAADGDLNYKKYTEPITIYEATQLQYYVENDATGARTSTADFNFTGTTTGIEGVTVENAGEAEYFDLTGRRVLNPAAGVYIRVKGGKAQKTMLR